MEGPPVGAALVLYPDVSLLRDSVYRTDLTNVLQTATQSKLKYKRVTKQIIITLFYSNYTSVFIELVNSHQVVYFT